MDTKLSPFLDLISDLKRKIDSLSTHLTLLQKDYNELKKSKEVDIEMMCQEAEERIKRRKFLIISGLKENSTASVKDRVRTDTEVIKEIAQCIGVTNFEPSEVSRIGKTGQSRPRLLRFKCSNLQDRSMLLRQSRMLRTHAMYGQVFVNPDLTLVQRLRNKDLREQLRQKRDAGGDFVIYRDQIVQRKNDNRQNFPGSF